MALDRQSSRLREPSGVPDIAVPARGAAPDLGAFMRAILATATVPSTEIGSALQPSRNYETAFDLLARASNGLQLLVARNQQLESELLAAKAKAAADLETANGITARWERMATSAKLRLEENEPLIVDLRRRLAVDDLEIAEARDTAVKTEQSAAAASKLTVLFHDKIIAAFGIGSQSHATLDAVATGRLTGGEP